MTGVPSIAIVSATLDAREGLLTVTIAVAGAATGAPLAIGFGDTSVTRPLGADADGGIAVEHLAIPAGEPRHPWPALEVSLGGITVQADVVDGTPPLVAISTATLDRETGELAAIGFAIGRRPGDRLVATLAGVRVGEPRPFARKDVAARFPWTDDAEPGWRLRADAPITTGVLAFGIELVRDGRAIAIASREIADDPSTPRQAGTRWALLPMRGGGVPDFDRCARAMTPRTRRRLLASRAFQREWSHPEGRVAARLRRAIVETMVAKGETAGVLAIRLSTGALVEADPRVDEVIARRFLLDGIYEQGLIAWIQGFLRSGDAMFDVGACYGHVAMAAAASVGPAGRVVAIEANPGTAVRLRRDLALNPALAVTVFETAVSDRPGVARFMAVDTNLGGSRLAAPGDSEDSARAVLASLTTVSLAAGQLGAAVRGPASLHEVEVATRTLDSIVEEVGFAPRLMKMDIEGAELLALRGATGLLAGRYGPPPWIAMEYSALFPTLGGRREDIFELLAAAGYRAWKMHGGKDRGGDLVAVPTAADAPRHDDLIFEPPMA